VYEALKHDQTENSVLPSVTDSEAGHKIPSVLIIEDNTDILNFMEQKLKKYYHTDTAVNAKSGIRKALSSSPDIIISDVMMPEMDGFEMCEVLKMDKRTSHIPIILVTARTGMENEIKGLTFGADDYISKPFPFKLLLLKIKNILYTRQNLKEQFLKSTLIYPEQLNISSVDDQFLQMATKAVKENIENVDFGVEKFCKYFQMSRRHVLRKMKSITGLSINEYIRVIRLKESYHLLSSGNMNISEVAYAVGFSDPKYFSNCFKKHFGHTPSKLKSE
jgi:DNA-binding response OmpR family regulator